ncbi:hypothetical protein [Cohnella massiliensis]|uniref:hypothetical protein n=1 Tax=Cohnella massiliensis TaxID=1816691 RepID=UPI0009BA5AFD|nr:hypothetical protein [Cohnella massiliensis]
MNSNCYEITRYRLLPDADPEAYKASVEKLNAMLPTMPGFVQRDVYYQPETKTWVEVVAWANGPAAKKAEETLMANPEFQAGFALVDTGTLTLELYSRISGASGLPVR